MKRGIVYYNQGTKCLIRLCVSLHTLRRSGYDGPVAIIHQGEPPDWFVQHIARYDAQLVGIPDGNNVGWALVQKPSLWRYTPFDTSIFIDADTAVLKNPAELFKRVEEKGFATTKFCEWTTDGRIMRGRINGWRSIISDRLADEALQYGPALNTGLFGWVVGHPILHAWEELTRLGDEANQRGEGPAHRIIDETACQVLAPQYDIVALDQCWNRSIKHTDLPREQTAIVHYHGGKHVSEFELCEDWRVAYWDMRHSSPQHAALGDPQGDRRLARNELPKRREDLTIVTCCTEQYVLKLLRCLPPLLAMPGLREQRWVMLIVDGDGTQLPAWSDALRERWPFIEYIACPNRCERLRHSAFHAFVFDVAKHINTPFWMKLDADSEPVSDVFEWPDYIEHAITADPWHYSKVKGDDDAKQHWLNTLDQWWTDRIDIPEEDRLPLFPADIFGTHGRRFKHRRCRSYCWIEQITFTRTAAKLYGQRLPVPSHDTSQWYLATRLGLSIKRHGFRHMVNA